MPEPSLSITADEQDDLPRTIRRERDARDREAREKAAVVPTGDRADRAGAQRRRFPPAGAGRHRDRLRRVVRQADDVLHQGGVRRHTGTAAADGAALAVRPRPAAGLPATPQDEDPDLRAAVGTGYRFRTTSLGRRRRWLASTGQTAACAGIATASISSSQAGSKMPVMMTVSATGRSPSTARRTSRFVQVIGPVGQEDRHLDEVVEAHAGGAQLRLDVGPGEPRLILELLGQRAVGAHGDLAADEQQPLGADDLHRLRVAAGRLHRIGRVERPFLDRRSWLASQHPSRHGVELGEQGRIARVGRGDDGHVERPVGADRAGRMLAREVARQALDQPVRLVDVGAAAP